MSSAPKQVGAVLSGLQRDHQALQTLSAACTAHGWEFALTPTQLAVIMQHRAPGSSVRVRSCLAVLALQPSYSPR